MPRNEPFFQRNFLKNDDCKCKCHTRTLNSEKWGVELYLKKQK